MAIISVKSVQKTLVFVFAIFTIVIAGSVSRLDDDGGYHLVVAPHKDAPQDFHLNSTDYFSYAEDTLTKFSSALYNATDQVFYIKSVTFAVPSHWDPDGIIAHPDFYTISGCHNADICLMKSGDFVHVENPNGCELPGERIHVPLNFFELNETSRYGSPENTLLKAWSRYRWGAWEEHGYPDDERFPYAHRKFQNHAFDSWQPTSCFEPGQISFNTSCVPTSPYAEFNESCRFYPESNSNSLTSLNFMPWVSSVTSFCDETTHDLTSPNRQNILCGYRSVIEVMKSSLDFSKVTPNAPSLPPIQFEYYWQTDSPLLYVVVDARFKAATPRSVLEDIVSETKKIFVHPDMYDVLGKVVRFPSCAEDKVLEVLQDWKKVDNTTGESLNEFVDPNYNCSGIPYELGREVNSIPQLSYRNDWFLHALEEVIEEVRTINHPQGTVILMLKDGGYPDGVLDPATNERIMDTPIFESELVSILQQENIVVSAIEVREKVTYPKVHLKQITEVSQGSHAIVYPDPNMDVKVATRNVVEPLPDLFLTGIDKSEDAQRNILMHRMLTADVNITLPIHNASIPKDQLVTMTITFTSSNDDIVVENCENSPMDPSWVNLTLRKQSWEWEETAGSYRRRVLEYGFPAGTFSSPDPCILIMNVSAPLHVIFTYDVAAGRAWEKLNLDITFDVPEDPADLPEYNDFGIAGLKMYAKLTNYEDRPVTAVKGIQAYLIDIVSKLTHGPYPLVDTGSASIDAVRGDGVYSGVAILPEGEYHLWVELSSDAASRTDLESFPHRNSVFGRFLTSDQVDVGCPSTDMSCVAEGFVRRRAFAKKYPRTVRLSGVVNMPPELSIARITNLTAVAKEGFEMELEWPLPFIHNETMGLDEMFFDIRWSETLEDLRDQGSFESTGIQLDLKSAEDLCLDGVRCSIDISNSTGFDMQVEMVAYFAVRVVDGSNQTLSQPSNIAEGKLEQSPPTKPTDPPESSTLSSESTSSTVTSEETEETSSESSTTTEPIRQWYKEKEATIMFISFAAAVVLLAILSVSYSCIKARLQVQRDKLMRRSHTSSMQTLHEEHIY